MQQFDTVLVLLSQLLGILFLFVEVLNKINILDSIFTKKLEIKNMIMDNFAAVCYVLSIFLVGNCSAGKVSDWYIKNVNFIIKKTF